MTARQSAAVDRALKLVAKGWTAYAAAKKEGVALSTIYRAIKRQKNAQEGRDA
jgi:transposase